MSPPSDNAIALATRMDGVVAMDLAVDGVTDLATSLRSIRLRGDLSGFAPWPGQDVMVSVPPGSESARWRRYTVRRAEPASGWLELWISTESDGPGAAWALGAALGDTVESVGPRGKVALSADAQAHVFVVDAAGLAAAFAMAESVRSGTVRVLAVLDDEVDAVLDDAAPVFARDVVASIEVLALDDPAALDAAIDVLGGQLDVGATAGYVFAELRVTRAAAARLRSIGLDASRIAAKPYWRADRANESHGEPNKDLGSE